jgi:hypothetical protein
MVNVEAALTHHLLQVAIGEMVSAIPSNAQKDDRRLGVPPLEQGLMLLHEGVSGRMFNELTSRL